jgi:DNA-binding winged helix-turn-helix (wHTH) protein
MALEDDSSQPEYLQTVVGHGYRFVAEFRPPDETPPSVESPKVSLEELGQAIMAAAGLHPEDDEAHKIPPKDPQKP